ncbi:putative RNA binding protein Ligatin/Tma64 [Talaromyces proteolyticus]|uniref:RNA binding protein Ligatin/Tma64 n=1 Tax=Talaromyces proteolyticus TaxID=1131652 RepID=A0AAD4KSI5_9EURO|nr:putative RNA binding protein Ligatin/Tma64 [Talaromyces proteolyticus]KAH8698387.1 putative RNA binding protein Ligatin/Tma64 [Talaromyces proteolyticus]
MFKKKPTIKTLSPLRSSDRRKIADQIIKDYKIPIPAAVPAEGSSSDENPATKETASNLTTIRNAILPENSLSARFTTTAGPQLREVQGTVYVGSHPEFAGEERILWFKLEQGPGADGRIYPTVYSLWHNPRIVPLLHTPELVMGKLTGGADLMTPGLVNGPPFPSGAVKGAAVAVSSTRSHTVPLFVGVCEVDVAALGEVQGSKGHAVRGLHWEGDELWAWSASSRPGQLAPEVLEGWEDEVKDVEEGLEELDLKEKEAEEQGGVALKDEEEEAVEIEPEKEPTVKEIEEAFVKAFIYSLYQLKKDNPNAPNHGLSLPVQPSALISSLITPYLPVYSTQQAQYYQIKRTSWKNVKKFIKHLDKEQLVKSKDRNGQETVIIDVDFNDYRLAQFTPYRLPNRNIVENSGKAVSKPAQDGIDPSVGQTITVQILYRPTQKLTPTFFPALPTSDPKNYYKYSEVSSHLDEYLSSQNPPLISATNRRIIKLNPFLANIVYNSSSADDRAALARGEVTRDGLLKRLISDASLLNPYHAILKQSQTVEDVKPKSGSPPKVTVVVEKRGSNKTVTKVSGIEVFGIIPALLAEELQKKCASSTSVAQATGAVKGVLEILVQGDQRNAIETALERRGVRGQWVDVVDKTKKKKK